MSTARTANELLSNIEEGLKTYQKHPKQTDALLLPPSKLFDWGACLHRLPLATQTALDDYLQSLPATYVARLLQFYLQCCIQQWSSDNDNKNKKQLLDRLCGLWEHLSTARAVWLQDSGKLVEEWVQLQCQQDNFFDAGARFLALYLGDETDWERFLQTVQALQQRDDDALWEAVRLQLSSSRNSVSIVLNRFPDHANYLRSLLQYSDANASGSEAVVQELRDAVQGVNLSKDDDSKPAAIMIQSITPQDELQRRIDQVQVILPHLGQGFIEACLSQYKGNVEETVSNIVADQLPPHLQRLDRSLPRQYDASTKLAQQEMEAKQITKRQLQAQAKKEEEKFLKLSRFNLYDDDYDDQYDDMDGVGKLDSGLYDDYESVIEYNKFVREGESEDSFWEESKNTNRTNNSKQPRKKQFGPDKVKGGRIPGRGRGGRGAERREESGASSVATSAPQSTTTSSQATKKPNLKAKARKMDRRREQQKKAQLKRTGI